MCFHASPWSRALCSHCAADRRGKWKTSIGNHPRSGANGLSTSAWLPRVSCDLGMRAMDDLADRLVQRRGIVDRRERREADGHALVERCLPVRPRDEDAQERGDRPVAGRHRVEHVAERGAARPPELVRVGVDHPVGAEVRRRQSRHAGDPLVLAKILPRLADQVDVSLACVPLEDLRRPVDRAIVGRDHEVRARVEMEREPGLDRCRPRPAPAAS